MKWVNIWKKGHSDLVVQAYDKETEDWISFELRRFALLENFRWHKKRKCKKKYNVGKKTCKMAENFATKYRSKDVDRYIGNELAVQKLLNRFSSKDGEDYPACVMISGASGCGRLLWLACLQNWYCVRISKSVSGRTESICYLVTNVRCVKTWMNTLKLQMQLVYSR